MLIHIKDKLGEERIICVEDISEIIPTGPTSEESKIYFRSGGYDILALPLAELYQTIFKLELGQVAKTGLALQDEHLPL